MFFVYKGGAQLSLAHRAKRVRAQRVGGCVRRGTQRGADGHGAGREGEARPRGAGATEPGRQSRARADDGV